MVLDLIKEGYGEKEDLNCAEKLLYASNEAYNLGLDKKALKLSAGFGGGMAIESVCGALTGAIMVLSCLFVEKNAHESDKIKILTKELLSKYEQSMESIYCDLLKDKHRTEKEKCRDIIVKAAEVLDEIVQRELRKF